MSRAKTKQAFKQFAKNIHANREREKEIIFSEEERALIYANIVLIQNLHNIVVEGKTPYRIICEYVDHATRTIYHFTSEYLWYNPKPYLLSVEVPIYVDPTDFSRYQMDLDKIMS